MRASDRSHVARWARVVAALMLALCAGGAALPRPLVSGRGEAVDVVREGLAVGRGLAEASQWERRAYDLLRDEGWMWARVRATVDPDDGRLRLEIEPGPRARIAQLEVRCPEPELARAWREASGLAVGDWLRPGQWERRVRTGLRVLGERGRPFASVTVVEQRSDATTGDVALTLFLRTGEVATIGAVRVEGATHTREDVLARISGLSVGETIRESALEHARGRLEGRPALVEEVEAIDVRRRSEPAGTVDVVLRVRQPASTGRFSAAVGAVRGVDGEGTSLSGSVDLALLDLFGTARRFEGRWSDDGRSRSRLDVAYLEPAVFGSSIDVGLEFGQRHEDEVYDTFRADLRLAFASAARRSLGLSLGFDRSTFLGETGRVRARQRIGASFGLERPRPYGPGAFGRLRSTVEAARVRDTRVLSGGGQSVEASVTQTLVEFDGDLGRAWSRVVATRVHLNWRSTETDRLPLPRSELWAIGGATTVRGYEEERFLGERIAWGGVEMIFGPPRGGQAYGFVDAGWVQSSADREGVTLRDERWLSGFGIGIRSPTTLGAIDLSLGFAERLGFDAGKLHLVLTRSF